MTILVGDCRATLADLPERSVQTVVTSPPYYGLRDYGVAGQIGLEATPDEYVAELVDVFRAVCRVLRDDGTVWLNLGDSYAVQGGARSYGSTDGATGRADAPGTLRRAPAGHKPKDLLGIPWLVAFALRADGWYLRSEIIWSKPNPMPESVTDRPTRAHEQVFLLSKGPRYVYDADAIREGWADERNGASGATLAPIPDRNDGGCTRPPQTAGRNKRTVWTVATQPYAGAHFATFPPRLIEPCVLAGAPPKACGECGAPWQRVARTEIDDSRPPARQNIIEPEVTKNGQGTNARGSATWGHWTRRVTEGWRSTCEHDDPTGRATVLDPFAGAGTVGVVSAWHNREFIGCELNAEYAAMAEQRIALEGRPGAKARHEASAVSDAQLGLLGEVA